MSVHAEIARAREIAIALQGFGYKVPNPVTAEWIEHAESKGMIRKADLIVGAWYVGCCRVAFLAQWLGDRFVMLREKPPGHHRAETYNHPEDADSFDKFVPTLLVLTPTE